MKKITVALAAMLAVCSVDYASARQHHRHHRGYHHSRIATTQEAANDPYDIFSGQDSASTEQTWESPRTVEYRVRTRHGYRRIHREYASNDNSDSDWSFGSGLASRASQYMGMSAGQLGLPRSLWCADFMNKITHSGKDRTAMSYARRGSPAPYGCTDCVAVTRRRGGGHVGIVTGYDGNGNPILISGNHSHRVGVGTYRRGSVVAYRYL